MTYLWCYILLLGSALLPWLNSEVIMASMALVVSSCTALASLVLVATAGQMTGKCILYWAGRGVVHFPRIQKRVEKFGNTDRKWGGMTVLFLSSTFGVPPFYPVSVLAGSLRIPFRRFLLVGAIGRLLHYAGVAAAAGWFWAHTR